MSSINDLSGERNNVCGSLLYESISEIIIGKAVLMYWRAHEGIQLGEAPQHLTYDVTLSSGESFWRLYKVLVAMSTSILVRYVFLVVKDQRWGQPRKRCREIS